uniref:Uncharacterized protein n=1 Tax=Caenorhabditis japonica TaxID=281687 RepID=A0A8R1E9X8_CAEJA
MKLMDDRFFLILYACAAPAIIWTTTLVLAFIRVWRNSHRELAADTAAYRKRIRATTQKIRRREIKQMMVNNEMEANVPQQTASQLRNHLPQHP